MLVTVNSRGVWVWSLFHTVTFKQWLHNVDEADRHRDTAVTHKGAVQHESPAAATKSILRQSFCVFTHVQIPHARLHRASEHKQSFSSFEDWVQDYLCQIDNTLTGTGFASLGMVVLCCNLSKLNKKGSDISHVHSSPSQKPRQTVVPARSC